MQMTLKHFVGAIVVLVIAQVIANQITRQLNRTNSASVLAFAKPADCGCKGA